MRHVTDLECNELADPRFLKANAQSPDILHLKGSLLADYLGFVPWFPSLASLVAELAARRSAVN